MSNQHRYSSISTINHWVTALLVVVMLALGYVVATAPSETIEDYVLGIHISLGFFVFLFVAWRVIFRLYEGFPENIGKNALEGWAAYVVHRAILFLLVLMVITGPMYLFTENECVNAFNWFSVCVPLESLSVIHEPMEWLHVNIGIYLLPALLLLHFIGAIRHYVNSGKREVPTDM
jgi:cytochrome b561